MRTKNETPEMRSLRSEVRKEIDTANKRIARLIATETFSPALVKRSRNVESTSYEGLKYKTTGHETEQQLRHILADVQQFNQSQTSTLAGARDYMEYLNVHRPKDEAEIVKKLGKNVEHITLGENDIYYWATEQAPTPDSMDIVPAQTTTTPIAEPLQIEEDTPLTDEEIQEEMDRQSEEESQFEWEEMGKEPTKTYWGILDRLIEAYRQEFKRDIYQDYSSEQIELFIDIQLHDFTVLDEEEATFNIIDLMKGFKNEKDPFGSSTFNNSRPFK